LFETRIGHLKPCANEFRLLRISKSLSTIQIKFTVAYGCSVIDVDVDYMGSNCSSTTDAAELICFDCWWLLMMVAPLQMM